ncbi:hypothetical protein Hanom_Chr01g00015831 [Helianthus anomalus]
MTKLEISDRGSKTYIQKISIKPGVKNVYAQKFLYENYPLSTTEQKVRRGGGGSAAPSHSHKAIPFCVWVMFQTQIKIINVSRLPI